MKSRFRFCLSKAAVKIAGAKSVLGCGPNGLSDGVVDADR